VKRHTFPREIELKGKRGAARVGHISQGKERAHIPRTYNKSKSTKIEAGLGMIF
jgi:hypothetical protein